MNVVQKSLYRSLLRQAKKIDENPALKFLVVTKPKSAFDRDNNSIINFNFDTHDLNNFIERFTGGGQFYRPESSMVQLVRNAFRIKENVDETEMVSTTFSALRLLADVNDMNEHLLESWDPLPPLPPVSDKDPSKNRSVLKQITDFSAVESFTGRLLITHPVSCIDQNEFHRAVILLHEDVDETDMLTGYIINKPHKGKKLRDIWSEHVAEEYPDLAECEVWDGGGMKGFAFLHTCPDINGSHEVDKGVYIHPMTTAADTLKQFQKFKKALEEKRTSVENIKFLHGMCGWWKNQLISELERTVWFLTELPEEGIKHHVQNPGSEESSNLWRSLLTRFGGEYEQIAATPDFPRKVLERLSQGQKDAISQLLKDS